MLRPRLRSALLTAALLAAAACAHAQDKPGLKSLDDAELSATWGQALLDVTNTQQGNYDFSRITLKADITMSSSFSGLVFGLKPDGTSDINISTLNFGRSDSTAAARTVAITNPYFEWVYSGADVVGMRFGFNGIAGDVGLLMNSVNGSLSVTTPSGTGTGTGTVSGTGTQLTSLNGSAGSVALNAIGGVTAGNTYGASRDFFLSVLKSAVSWPSVGGMASATAQSGFWLNWTDRLAALNTTGTVPPNTPKVGP
jgi:hypothetical protein